MQSLTVGTGTVQQQQQYRMLQLLLLFTLPSSALLQVSPMAAADAAQGAAIGIFKAFCELLGHQVGQVLFIQSSQLDMGGIP